MFGTLFAKECKQIVKSLVFWIYVLILALFLSSQLKDSDWVADSQKPEPGQVSYGMKQSDDKDLIMGQTLANLLNGLNRESFATYPTGFYKEVIPSEEEMRELKGILKTCTGKSWDTLIKEQEDYFISYDLSDPDESIMAYESYVVEPKESLTYQQFQKQMKRVVSVIGKGSDFDKEKYENSAREPKTYEEALEEYKVMCRHDKINGAYMRLYCDYAGIMLAILPVFLGVTRCLRDKRAQAVQVIQVRSVSSTALILSRYLANVCMAFLPVLLIGFALQLPYCYHAQTIGVQPDYLAFLTYPIIWLLPEIMIVMALAFFVTELSDKIFAIFIQIFWLLAEEFTTSTLVGDFGMKLMLRWNTVGETEKYLDSRWDLYLNRGVYTVLSVILVLLCIAVYEKKRREGVSLYAKVFKNRR